MQARFLVALTAAVAVSPLLRADSWESPTPRVFGSVRGGHGFKILNPQFLGPSEGALFRLDAQGKEQIVWHTKLVNTPYGVLVDEQGKFVATIDTYGNLGFAHALVVYGDKGKVIRDFKLEDVLTGDEIATKVTRTVSSRHWTDKATFQLESGHLEMRLKWGKIIRVELATGKIAEME
jgi:hypothetical protein